MRKNKLIQILKKIPGNPEIFYAHPDNAKHETAGYTSRVIVCNKADFEWEKMSLKDQQVLEKMPDTFVVIRG